VAPGRQWPSCDARTAACQGRKNGVLTGGGPATVQGGAGSRVFKLIQFD
jgi:hypothetical protein